MIYFFNFFNAVVKELICCCKLLTNFSSATTRLVKLELSVVAFGSVFIGFVSVLVVLV